MIKTVNKLVATLPPVVDKLEEKRSAGGLMLPGQKTSLIELTLVFAYELGGKVYPKGSKILVNGEIVGFDYAKRVYSFKTDHFVLIPEERIVAINEE
jgi:hypothetical protein